MNFRILSGSLLLICALTATVAFPSPLRIATRLLEALNLVSKPPSAPIDVHQPTVEGDPVAAILDNEILEDEVETFIHEDLESPGDISVFQIQTSILSNGERDDVDEILRLQMMSDPRVTMTVPELVRYYGYGVEVHHVTTDDGYILELHRVLAPGDESCSRGAHVTDMCRPVLLQHGLLGSSSAWVMNEPGKALGYILADRGYDVWMGNARGNIYSMNHTSLDVLSEQFWDFSFDEMGKFDLPAVIDYILNATHHETLHFVGHSMGTTMFWVLCHEHPDFTQKRVASMSALGPAAYVGHAKAPIILLAPFNRQLSWFLVDILHEYRILNPNFILMKLTTKACSLFRITELICSNAVFMLIGFDSKDLNLKWLPIILGQLNAGASTKTVVHFAQLVWSGNFQTYDYRSSNRCHYNQSTPIQYSLDRVRVPVMLKWGKNDWLADPQDVAHLYQELSNSQVVDSVVPNPRFNHLDFLWGGDAAQLVYKDVIRFIETNS